MGNDHHLRRSSLIHPQGDVVKEEILLMKILPPDDSDNYELAEVGCEIIMVEGQPCSIPYELYDLLDLKGILSLETWNCHLTEEERFSLATFLPDMDQEMFWLTVKELLAGDDLFFGSPLEKFYNGLKGGLYSPQITCLRNSLQSLQRNESYHSLRSYHENMTRTFDEMKRVWDRNRPNAATVEERIHIWNSRRSCEPKFVVDLNAFPDEDASNKGNAILLNGLVSRANRKAKGVLKLKPTVADVGRSRAQPWKQMPKGVLKIKHKYDPLNQVDPRGKLGRVPSDSWSVHADAPSAISPPKFPWKKDDADLCGKLPIFCQINRDGSSYRSPVVMQDCQREWNIVGTQQSGSIKQSFALENHQEKRLNGVVCAAGSWNIQGDRCSDEHELFTSPSEYDTSNVANSGVGKCTVFPITYKRKKPYRKLINQVDSLDQQQEVAVNLEPVAPSGAAKLKPMAIKIRFRGWKPQNG